MTIEALWLVPAVLATGLWLGSTVAFALITAPTLFGELERDRAGGLVGLLLPRTQHLGWWAGLVDVAALSVEAYTDSGAASIGFLLWSLPLLLALLLWWVAWQRVTPAATRTRTALVQARALEPAPEELPALESTFSDLHRLSTRLTMAALLLVIVQSVGIVLVALGA